jgi:hypothetical protein
LRAADIMGGWCGAQHHHLSPVGQITKARQCSIALMHYITLRYVTLHYITLYYITLCYITLCYVTLHYITLYYVGVFVPKATTQDIRDLKIASYFGIPQPPPEGLRLSEGAGECATFSNPLSAYKPATYHCF